VLPEQDHTDNRYRGGAFALGAGAAVSWLLVAVLTTVDFTLDLPDTIVTAACALAITCTVVAVELTLAAGHRTTTRRLAAQVGELTEALGRYVTQHEQDAHRRHVGQGRGHRGRTAPRQRRTPEQEAGPDDGQWRAYLAGRYDKEVGN
jgi:hypothetical protein